VAAVLAVAMTEVAVVAVLLLQLSVVVVSYSTGMVLVPQR
jgi:hypothetical protein